MTTTTHRLPTHTCRTCGESAVSAQGLCCTLCEMATPYGQPVTRSHRPAARCTTCRGVLVQGECSRCRLMETVCSSALDTYSRLWAAWDSDMHAVHNAYHCGAIDRAEELARMDAVDAAFDARLKEQGWSPALCEALELAREAAELAHPVLDPEWLAATRRHLGCQE